MQADPLCFLSETTAIYSLSRLVYSSNSFDLERKRSGCSEAFSSSLQTTVSFDDYMSSYKANFYSRQS